MIDLEEKYINFLKSAISSVLNEYKVYMFGSRTKGRAKTYSDIDIAIKSKELTDEAKSKINFKLENSTLPYKVDIIDLDNISDSFKKLIENDLIEF